MNFNKNQQKAISIVEGPLITVACPGSGKTTMVVERAKQMVESGINPSSILIMTFTKKAAVEMETRFKKKMNGIHIRFGTIHSVCYEIFRKEISSEVRVLSELETWNFFRQICKKDDLEEEDFNDYVRRVITEISAFRNDGQKISKMDDYQVKSCDSKEEFIRIFKAYQEAKKENYRLDFDDILIYVDALFHKNKEALSRWQERFRYIVVDEFQDVNRLQADIIYMLAERYQNLCVVGDDDQSIYKFRGARPEIMLEFQQNFPKSVRVDLDTNYRSGKGIIAVADKLIHQNKMRFQKEFKPFRSDEGKITLLSCVSEEDEHKQLIQNIKDSHKKGVPYSEMAVLYRVNYECISIAIRLLEADIPFTCTEDIRSLSNHFIFKDIVAYYRIVSGIAVRKDYVRILNRPVRYLSPRSIPLSAKSTKEVILGLKKANKETGWKWSKKDNQIYNFSADLELLEKYQSDAFRFVNIFLSLGYEDFLETYKQKHRSEEYLVNVMEKRLQESAQKFKGRPVSEWINSVIETDEEMKRTAQNGDADAVTLATMHSAKGLEWDNVHIININDENIPYIPSDGEYDPEEERRLFYVGLTRARNDLTLYTETAKKSPFLAECGFK